MKSRLAIALLAATALLAGAFAAGAPADRAGRAAKPGVGLKPIGGFDHPTYVTGAPGYPHLLFVTEQPGRVKVVAKGRKRRRSFLNISGLVDYDQAERGLLSVAFPPDYPKTGLFYVYFVNNDGNIEIDEFHRATSTAADPASRRTVIVIPHPVNANHNGGQLQFDGNLLFFGTGDGGAGGDPPDNAQNKDVLLGKLIRIDPRRQKGGAPYGIPNSNPFVGRDGRDEIFSYGLRNPFRFSFDRVTATKPRIVIGDVGQDKIEEVDYETLGAAKGANFGWNSFEGYSHFEAPFPKGTTFPVFAYPHSRNGSCSVIGGYVVGDRRLKALYGRYVYADLCEGRLRSFKPALGRVKSDHELGVSIDTPTSFGQDDQGRIYVASLNGPVYRLVPR